MLWWFVLAELAATPADFVEVAMACSCSDGGCGGRGDMEGGVEEVVNMVMGCQGMGEGCSCLVLQVHEGRRGHCCGGHDVRRRQGYIGLEVGTLGLMRGGAQHGDGSCED